ncbi:MAG: N-acetylmuramoyl-L-alanine amidase [Paludibacter sp.]
MFQRFKTLILLLIFSNAVVWSQSNLKIVNKPVSFGKHTCKSRNIDAIIVHSVYNAAEGDKYDVDLIIKQFSRYRVSSHYMIGRDGTIFQLVKEKDVSYHAGRSQLPDGRTGVNSCSIGIELITSKDSLDAPTDKQVKSLTTLVKDIRTRHKIKYVLRHSDIAPGRKTDPWNMNWEDFLKRIEEKKRVN